MTLYTHRKALCRRRISRIRATASKNDAPFEGPSNAFVGCTPPSNKHVFISVGANGCSSPGSRRKRNADSPTQDDNIQTSDHIPVTSFLPQPTVQTPSYTWPTASGITNAQADSACRGKLKSLTVYTKCATYVDVDNIVFYCILDIAVS